MEQQLTISEMMTQFSEEWLLVGDPRTNDALEVLDGRILHHSKDRDEVYRTALALHPKRCAIVFTGHMPSDTAIVL